MSEPLAVAALSARMLAEAAREGGYRPLALDLFGDLDTRRAVHGWWPIGSPARLAIDGDALAAALARIAIEERAMGWIAGSGFEAAPELLAAGAVALPLIGNSPEAFARVRTPAWFFGRLAALGVPLPETAFVPPADTAGWLSKDAGSSGGWHVRSMGDDTAHAEAAPSRPGARYYQRLTAGDPMSALFLADGKRSCLIGVSRQIVRRLGPRPYVFRGCLGPVALPAAVRRALGEMLDALVADIGLRGLNGLDFLVDGDRLAVLELNPRPSASMDLYRDVLPGGLIRAHVQASVEGRLPDPAELALPAGCRGFEVVFASRPARFGGGARAAVEGKAWCHDLPAEVADLGWGEPVCTVSAAAPTAAGVKAVLTRRRRKIRLMMEQIDE